MCTSLPQNNQIQRCAAWEAEQRRLERSCFLCRTERKVCDVRPAVPLNHRDEQACNDRLDRYADNLRRCEAEKVQRARRERGVQKQQQQQRLPPARPARPPPALRPAHIATQQQVRPTNGYSGGSGSGRPVAQQRVAVPLSKYATLPNARPSPMPRVPVPAVPTATTSHRPTRERRATQHPAATARKVSVPHSPPSPMSAREAASLRRYTPAPVSPIGKGRYDSSANKSYFDFD